MTLSKEKQELVSAIAEMQDVVNDPEMSADTKSALAGPLAKAKEMLKNLEAQEKAPEKKPAEKAPAKVSTIKEKIKKYSEVAPAAKKKAASKAAKEPTKAPEKKSKVKEVTKADVSDLLKKIRNNPALKKAYAGTPAGNIKRDASRKANKPGKHISENGNVYYEHRSNRSDVNRKAPYLEDGGSIEDLSREGWTLHEPTDQKVTDLLGWSASELEDNGDTITGIWLSDKSFWIAAHASGKFSTEVMHDSAYGTFEECVAKIEEEMGEAATKGNELTNTDGSFIEGSDEWHEQEERNFLEDNEDEDYGIERFAHGGRIKSALMRDRKYISEQEWERNYKRKTPGQTYEQFAAGGRIKSALNRDRKYVSEQEWERNYIRRIPGKRYASFAEGGEVESGITSDVENITIFGYTTQNFDESITACLELDKAKTYISNNLQGAQLEEASEALVRLAQTVDIILGIYKRGHETGRLMIRDMVDVSSNVALVGVYNFRCGYLVNTDFIDYHVAKMAKYIKVHDDTQAATYAKGGTVAPGGKSYTLDSDEIIFPESGKKVIGYTCTWAKPAPADSPYAGMSNVFFVEKASMRHENYYAVYRGIADGSRIVEWLQKDWYETEAKAVMVAQHLAVDTDFDPASLANGGDISALNGVGDKNNPLKVVCASAANPDFNEHGEPAPFKVYFVKSLDEASRACRSYIEQYDLGGGNWVGGRVYDKTGFVKAYVSYNGRVWNKDPGVNPKIKPEPVSAEDSAKEWDA